MIRVNDSFVLKDISYGDYAEEVAAINQGIDNRTLVGSDFLGWAKYPETYDKEEFQRILAAGKRIAEEFDVLVVCGIGGSYLGARAAIEGIQGLRRTQKPEIIFMGQTFAPSYIHEVLEYLKDKKFAINVISKSGTTTETAVAFRLLSSLLEKQIGKENMAKAIFATTDAKKGALL